MSPKTVNIHEAKTHLSRLLDEVVAGQEYIIAKAGRPVARLVPLIPQKKRKLGILKGKLQVPENFDDPLPDEISGLFEGKGK